LGVFAESFWRGNVLQPHAIPGYVFIACQLCCLLTWLVVGRMSPKWSAFWCGMLWAGCGLAATVAVILVLPSLMGLFVLGIGALGFTPIFTAWAFFRRAREASAAAGKALRAYPKSLLGIFAVYAAVR